MLVLVSESVLRVIRIHSSCGVSARLSAVWLEQIKVRLGLTLSAGPKDQLVESRNCSDVMIRGHKPAQAPR